MNLNILIVCCDGLKGLPEAIESQWPQATVQTCVVHLIRASMGEPQHPHRLLRRTQGPTRGNRVPFLAFGPGVRRVIYTTNSIESLNYQLRKIIKNRGHFPNDDAVKLLWLALRDIEDKRAQERVKQQQVPAIKRTSVPRLVEGAVVTNWNAAIYELFLAHPDRLTEQIN